MRAHVEPYKYQGRAVRGRWRIVVELDRDARGGRRRRVYTVDASGKKEAERQMREFLSQMENQSYVEPSKLTVSAWTDRWIEEYAPLSCAAKSTIVGYKGVLRRYITPELGDVRLQKLDPETVQRAYQKLLDRGLSPRTVIQVHSVLHKALKKAVELKYIPFNVTDSGRGVTRPRIERRELVALEPYEQIQLLEAARDSAIFLPIWLALYTGMRRSEILALRWDEVDLANSTLKVTRAWDTGEAAGDHNRPWDRYYLKPPKSDSGRRSIDLDPQTIRVLKSHKAQQDSRRKWLLGDCIETGHDTHAGKRLEWGNLVVSQADGSPWWPDAFSAVWQEFRKATGTRARFHDLRRTHGSNLLMAGANPKVVQQRLGHHSAAFTLDVYTTVLSGIERESAERAASFVGFDLDAGEVAV